MNVSSSSSSSSSSTTSKSSSTEPQKKRHKTTTPFSEIRFAFNGIFNEKHTFVPGLSFHVKLKAIQEKLSEMQ